MRHRVGGRKFGRNTNQRKALFRNLAVSLILNERITTTEAKAKTIRPVVEKLVTMARDDSEHHRRLVMARLADERATAKLFDIIGPRFDGQPGGYTRIYKIGVRRGDAAPVALIEFVA
ncbi:MAG TPA: 50S ribosomal protein L17 [Nitrolancea sp.]|jgi:large subunit ribosomal protein L17|nr:50S ribosomal protein L17 [Nitrolancea sp.]